MGFEACRLQFLQPFHAVLEIPWNAQFHQGGHFQCATERISIIVSQLQVGAGGVVRDPAVHRAVIESTIKAISDLGFSSSGWVESPIKGSMKGNTEFLAHFSRLPSQPATSEAAAY